MIKFNKRRDGGSKRKSSLRQQLPSYKRYVLEISILMITAPVNILLKSPSIIKKSCTQAPENINNCKYWSCSNKMNQSWAYNKLLAQPYIDAVRLHIFDLKEKILTMCFTKEDVQRNSIPCLGSLKAISSLIEVRRNYVSEWIISLQYKWLYIIKMAKLLVCACWGNEKLSNQRGRGELIRTSPIFNRMVLHFIEEQSIAFKKKKIPFYPYQF